MRTTLQSLGLVLLATWSIGCATTPGAGPKTSPMPGGPVATTSPVPTPVPSSTTAPVSPVPGHQVGTTASGGVIMSGNRPVVADSLPSTDAQAVLQSIPEPLPADQKVPAPAGTGAAVTGVAITPDSAATDTADGELPVPEPTAPLGDRPSSSSAPSASGSASTPPPPPPPAAGAAPAAAPAQCYRVQVAAVPEADRSERLKSAAESQLSVPCVVQKEKTLYKVRTRDCQDSAGAEAIRKRAISAGFEGAFKIQGSGK